MATEPGLNHEINPPRSVDLRTVVITSQMGESAVISAQFTDEPSSWQDEANCLGVDPDLFFPERGASTKEAKEVCRGCVVRLDCLEYALVNVEKFGIWGGLSERERRRLRRQSAMARNALRHASDQPSTFEPADIENDI